MTRAFTLAAALSCLFCALVASAQENPLMRIANATVMVCVETGEPPEYELNWGSGIIVSPGFVVTNAHVVGEKAPTRMYIQNRILPPTPVTVVSRRYNSNEFVNATVVSHIVETLLARSAIEGVRLTPSQQNYDMAVLAFQAPGLPQPPAVAFTRSVVPGEPVTAVGYPGRSPGEGPVYQPETSGRLAPGALLSHSNGVVGRIMNKEPEIIMHSAPCSTGNSGGPLVNRQGEVVGMQTWTSVPGGAGGVVSMAIGSRDIVAFLESLGIAPAAYGSPQPWPNQPEPVDARPILLPRADAGDPDAMAVMGLLYFLGDCGFVKNDDIAVYHLEKALEASPDGQNANYYRAGLAAVLLQSSRHWRPDYALELLRTANNSDHLGWGSRHPDARLLAYEASLYMQGRACGVRPDAERAFMLAEKALNGGFALPYALAGYHYYFGNTSGGRDHAKALRYAREAAANNIPEGISLLAHLYYNSDVLPQTDANLQTAKRLAAEAAEMGDPWAYGLLANIYHDSPVPGEKEQALKLALLGTCYGNRLSFLCLGRMAWDFFTVNPSDFPQAARAWAYTDVAERLGAGGFRLYGRTGVPVSFSRNILGRFSPEMQRRIVEEGRREQEALTAAKPPAPRISRLAGAQLIP